MGECDTAREYFRATGESPRRLNRNQNMKKIAAERNRIVSTRRDSRTTPKTCSDFRNQPRKSMIAAAKTSFLSPATM